MTRKRRSRSQKETLDSKTPPPSTTKGMSATDRRQSARAARERKAKLRNYFLVAGGVLVVGFIVFLVGSRMFNQPGELVTAQGNSHVDEAQVEVFDYNSRPPTSGPHLGSILPWGIYNQPVSEGRQIHNLEDGGVGIWYDCPNGCPELVAQLEGIVNDQGKEGLIMAPYPDMETRIALTAWSRIDRLEGFDKERITNFVKAYRGIDHHSN